MMVPFDGTGGPQQGQPSVAPSQLGRGPMPPHPQAGHSGVMGPGHHQPMNPPHYGHRSSAPMHAQPPPYGMPPQQSPARQGSFSNMPSHPQYSSHPPLHSPHQPQAGPPPMHPGMPHPSQQMHRQPTQMNRPHASSMGQAMPMQRDPMRPPSSQGRPPQQQYMGGQPNMGANWRSENDTAHRRDMIQHIIRTLKKDRNGSPESMSKLPQMAKQLEVSLYRNAPSFDAYMDMSTLKKRLQQIAVEVSRKTRTQNEPSSRDRYVDRQPSFSNQNGMRQDHGGRAASPYVSNSANGGRMVNMDDINPMASTGGGQTNYGAPRPSMGSQMQPQSRSASTPQQSSQNRNDPEWKLRIKHKQQRLLLLHHAAKCPHEDGRCTATPHCADMKKLWQHMEGCKDNQCRVAHCFSSRAILSHYRKCTDANCPACGPVRETVRRSRSSSSRPASSSTGPMMNSMRAMPPNPQPSPQLQSVSTPNDPLASSASFASASSSVGGSSFRQPTQANHSSMPPPSSNGPSSSSTGMQYSGPSSSYRQPTTSGTNMPSSHIYRSDQNGLSSRSTRPEGISSRSSRADISLSGSHSLSPKSSSRPSGNRNDSEWQKIRHKQQRLLLLRHASRCQHEAGDCPVTPHCASMKRLWGHIAHCKDQQCKYQHCLSSRYVLSHYRRCKDSRCPACAPVRETIRRSTEREKGKDSLANSAFSDKSIAMPPSDLSQENINLSPTESSQPDRKRIKKEHVNSSPSVEDIQPVPSQSMKDESMPRVASKQMGSDSDTKNGADHSLLHSFTIHQLDSHLASLDRKAQMPPAKLKSKCLEVLKGLQTHQHGWVFNCPVDPVELGLPDYFDIIKKPMDLGTIQKRLENGFYRSIEEFQTDVNLTFDNAMTYNETGSVVYDMATQLKAKFEVDMKKLLDVLDSEDRQRRENERACTLCGCEKLLFEPPVYFCNGMNCQSQRIRRNSHFYIGGNNQYFWCSTCFNELDEKIPIELVDMTIMKKDLKKKKNDEVHEESWVQCDSCERWVHQICGLFNTRQNKEHHSEYCCPQCLYEKRKRGESKPSPRPPGAADLPRTTLSEWLEQHIAKKVSSKKRVLAEEKAQSESISLEEATRQIESGPIIIRQVTAMDRKLEVRELMKERYAHKKYPDEFPFRCKCIVVFQHLDGVDVILFALYVYEHGENNPPPNARVVYISYLDSVYFMKPRRIRTFVYHEILISYLDYARRKGFSTAHIWACPPLKGDDYIFYAKPEDQKTPRDSRLRQWYIDMLIEAQKRNIVGKVTNMYDLYFANEDLDATAVPYLEGDYFPGEAENIIKMLQEGGGKKGGLGGKKKKSKSKNSKKGNGSTGTRSTGVDEEALIASGMFEGARSFKDLDRDQVMVKLGETIQPMKESFIVAFLNWSGAREEDMVVPEEIEKARREYAAKDDGELAGSKRDALGNVRDSMSKLDQDGKPVKVIDDDDEDLDCEFLNNRQAFLNLCRGNHYQFDELRRAKHTSMMILWHLHNRDAPKFVQQCVSCSREILSGTRYHCNTCPDYDLCQDCYKDPNASRGACSHKLQPIAVESDANQERSGGMSEAERLQRQRSIMLHIQLIEHASRCDSKSCTSTNCAKMKSYLAHARSCRVKVQGGCRICKRIWTLLRIHAQKCKEPNCPIPQCMAIREKMRQLQKQQQAMDDRRRLEMNRHMRFSIAGGGSS